MKDVLIIKKPKPRCPNCDKKISRLDRMKLKLMEKAMSINPQAQKEFEELKGHCPDCLASIFKARGELAWEKAKEQIGEQPLPKKFHKAFEKAGFIDKEQKK